MVFDREWFQRHQSTLLFLLNNRILKYWFRWVMRIRKHDLPLKTKILDFGPNWFTHSAKRKGDQIELQTSFRSNEKYARRLWFAFEPIWWAFHAWDMVTKPIPSLNLGFDTLPTKYSTPGATVSGRAGRAGVDETLATIRAGAGNSNIYDVGAGVTNQMFSSATSPRFDSIFRGIFLFDTSALPEESTPTAATIGLYGATLTNTFAGAAYEVDIVSSNPASNTALANASYGLLGATPYSSVAFASLATAAYNSFALDASGIATINKTGISKFGSRINWDTDNSMGGTWGASKSATFTAQDGGTAGTTQDPKLDIIYLMPATAGFLFNFV